MKLTVILMLAAVLQVSAKGYSQEKISVNFENVKLSKALKAIEKKSDFRFVYSNLVLNGKSRVTLSANNVEVKDLLRKMLQDLNLTYILNPNNLIIIKGVRENVKDIIVKGRVVNATTGEPISGATIQIKGSTVGASTNEEGQYTITAADDGVLVVTTVGFESQEILINGRETIDVALNSTTTGLEEVVVVGYGTQKKVTVTGSVAAIQGSDLQKSPSINLSNSMAGRLPGVSAVQSSGEPGYDGSAIRVRGTNTLGNTSALIVIDGVPDPNGGLERINPADIESMSILKDASAAIYGARAANGVILITTKRGKTGKPNLSYDFNQGWVRPTIVPKMANSFQYAEMNNELTMYSQIPSNQWDAAWAAFQQTGSYTRTDNQTTINAPYSPDALQKYQDGSDPLRFPNTNWFKTTFKEWSPQSRHTLGLSGGTEDVQYFLSLGYQDQDAFYKKSATGYKQYDMRFNLDAKVNEYIKLGFGVTARQEFRHFPTQSATDIFRMLVRGKPTDIEVWPNGLPGPDIEFGQNPAAITTSVTGYDDDKRNFFQGNGRIEINIPGVEGLKLTGTASLDKGIRRTKKWETPWFLYFWDGTSMESDGVSPVLVPSLRSTFTDPRLTEADYNTLNLLYSGFINYDRIFGGGHSVNFMAAVTKEQDKGDDFNAFRRFFISPAIDQMFAGGDAEKDNGGSAFERARLSYFGRLAYNYQQKYLFEFLWREDGSYMFPKSGRWGFFPGVLVGWNISKENFWKNNFINDLKIRGSYGQMGNDQVFFNDALQEYQYLATYGFGSYIINKGVAKTLFETRLPNTNFTWEVANNMDVGVDGMLMNGKINFTLDYFYNKRDRILIQQQGSTPASAGITLPPVNMGRIDNRGFEFQVGFNDNVKDFTYGVSVNGGYAKNKVVFFDEAPGAPEWQKATGHSFGSNGVNYLAYLYDGVFKDQAEIDSHEKDYSALVNELRPGDMKFKDYNDDGKINGDDRVRLDKNIDPTFTYGVNLNAQYKNFDFSALFQGANGGMILMGLEGESGDIGNYLEYTYDHQWTVENHSSVYPRIANRGDLYYSANGTAALNTYYLKKNNYLRLKTIEVGYTLPLHISEKATMNQLRVYVNAFNLVTWDALKMWDPEATSSDAHYYPQSKIINLGVSVRF